MVLCLRKGKGFSFYLFKYIIRFKQLRLDNLFLYLILGAGIFLISTTYFLLTIWKERQQLKSLQSIIDSLNNDSRKKDLFLADYVDRFLASNLKLESLINIKTKALEVEHKKKSLYAYNNSHVLRAPVARVLGLSDLMRRSNNTHEIKELTQLITTEIESIDSVIKEMSILLSVELENMHERSIGKEKLFSEDQEF